MQRYSWFIPFFCYVVFGVSTILLQQHLSYLRIAPDVGLLLVPSYVGSTILSMFSGSSVSAGSRVPMSPAKELKMDRTTTQETGLVALLQKLNTLTAVIALLDIAVVACVTLSVQFAGGLSNVIQAARAIIAGLLTRVLYGRKLAWGQWGGIAISFAGLAFNQYMMSGSGAHEETEEGTNDGNDASTASSMRMFGVTAGMIGAFLACLEGLLIENLMAKQAQQLQKGTVSAATSISSMDVGGLTGVIGVAVSALYCAIYVMPQADELFESAQVGFVEACWYYVVVLLVNMGLNYGFYRLYAESTSVTISMLYALRSAFGFIGSALLFCDVDSSECFSVNKGIAACLIIVGNVTYQLCRAPSAEGTHAHVVPAGPDVKETDMSPNSVDGTTMRRHK